MSKYGDFSGLNTGKYGPEKTPYLDTFHAVHFSALVSMTKHKQPPEVFCGKGILRNFAKFTEKRLCQSLFFNKLAGLRPEACNFI